MILTKTVKTKMAPFTKKHYESLGYKFEINKEIFIPVEHLMKNSAVKINVTCSGECKKIMNIQYGSYLKSIEKNDVSDGYCCKKCFPKLRTAHFLKTLGVSSPLKLTKYQNKKKETMLKLYGVEHYLQNKKIAKKIREKTKKTLIKKYGEANSFLSPGSMDKKNATMLKLYGTTNSQKIPTTKQKTESKLLEKYGVKNIRKIPGVEEKIRITKEKLGLQRPKNLISEMETYRNKCVVLKNKQRKKLFEIWDGYDYYDNEYIKKNLTLNHNNTNYPTIDHKISILYGFLNNLSVCEISSFDNLCITKKGLNSRKNKYSEKEFTKKINTL